MRRIISFILCMIIVVSLCSCALPQEIKRTAIDCRYTEQHTELDTTYEYVYDFWYGGFKLLPLAYTQVVPDKYELLYMIEYDNGTSCEKWEEVSRSEYVAFKGGEQE